MRQISGLWLIVMRRNPIWILWVYMSTIRYAFTSTYTEYMRPCLAKLWSTARMVFRLGSSCLPSHGQTPGSCYYHPTTGVFPLGSGARLQCPAPSSINPTCRYHPDRDAPTWLESPDSPGFEQAGPDAAGSSARSLNSAVTPGPRWNSVRFLPLLLILCSMPGGVAQDATQFAPVIGIATRVSMPHLRGNSPPPPMKRMLPPPGEKTDEPRIYYVPNSQPRGIFYMTIFFYIGLLATVAHMMTNQGGGI